MLVVAEERLVEERLADLGLSREILMSAVEAGELGRVGRSKLDPLSVPGSVAWGDAVVRLRAQLVPKGWRMENPSNLPLTVEPRLGIEIVVTSGSFQTGDPSLSPTTKHPKGPMMQVRVEYNQLDLFTEEVAFLSTPPEEARSTWLLLVYSAYHPFNDETGEHTASCELSLPAVINDKGYVTEWHERIILGAISLDDVAALGPDDELAKEADLDILLTRRS